jgi:hypothetical protein
MDDYERSVGTECTSHRRTDLRVTNHVIGSTTPELLKALGKRGVPLEMAKASRGNATTAHNAQETPLFALSIEKKALEAKTRGCQELAIHTAGRFFAQLHLIALTLEGTNYSFKGAL